MSPALSTRKRFLFATGFAAIAGLSACVGVSALLLRSAHNASWAEVPALLLFLFSLLLCAPVFILFDEYTLCTRPGQGRMRRFAQVRRVEMRAMIAACPASIRWALAGIALLALFQVLRLGYFEIKVDEFGHVADLRTLGVLAGATFFYSLCTTFLLAAAFMSGSYSAAARN